VSDFRGETLYFIVVDRFEDGNVANDIDKDGEFDATRTNWRLYWGGDIRGVINRLDYLQSMGVSSIWLTPLFDQMDGTVDIKGEKMAAYHGYWARDFSRLDEHLVDKPSDLRVFQTDDGIFDELVTAVHSRGMKLMIDVVCNHSSPNVGGGRAELFDDGKRIASFDKDKNNWYRKGEGVEDWDDLEQVQTRESFGLADFDEESITYRSYIKRTMGKWVAKGVDALRVDTVKHMPLWFWQEFTGDLEVLRPNLFFVGEWFNGGCWDDDSVEFASKSGMTMFDFAWRTAVVEALAHRSAKGFEQVSEVISKDAAYRDPSELVTFVDNHDLPRFLSLSDDPERFRLALLLTMVARGIPCVYYGNESFLHNDTNRGNDPYNRPMMEFEDPPPLGRDLAILAALRKASPALQRGGMRRKLLDADRYAFTRCWLGSFVLVAVNRKDEDADVGVTGVELPDGVHEDVLGGPAIEVTEGATRLSIPAKGIVVYAVTKPLPTGTVVIDIQVFGIRTEWGEELLVCGNVPELGEWDVNRAVAMEYIHHASWGTTVAFDASVGLEVHYKFVIKRKGAFVREPGRGHHRVVPAVPLPDGSPDGGVDAIWRDDWRE
jgi:cyclomaltodextrin glucanotransferase